MSSMMWPVPISFAVYKSAFVLANAILAASRNGSIQDPSKWWHWVLFAVLFWLYEVIAQYMKNANANE